MSDASMTAEQEAHIFNLTPRLGEWQPIETADLTEGNCLIVYGQDEMGGYGIEICAYLEGTWHTGHMEITATHWMPLPKEPEV